MRVVYIRSSSSDSENAGVAHTTGMAFVVVVGGVAGRPAKIDTYRLQRATGLQYAARLHEVNTHIRHHSLSPMAQWYNSRENKLSEEAEKAKF